MSEPLNQSEKSIFILMASLVLSNKKFIISIVTSCVLLSVAYSLYVPPQYTSTALVKAAAVDTGGKGGLASLASSLGGASDLLGFSGALNSDTTEARAFIGAKTFTIDLLLKDKLITHIYDKEWDGTKNVWISGGSTLWGKVMSFPKKAVAWFSQNENHIQNSDINMKNYGYTGPSLERAILRFESLLDVSLDRKTGYVTIKVTWKDPVVASDWINLIVVRVNEKMRLKTLNDMNKDIKYLSARMALENNRELKTAIANLYQLKLRQLVLAEGRKNFSLEFIDEPYVPEMRTSPKRKLIVIMAFILSLMASIAWLIFRKIFWPDIKKLIKTINYEARV